MKLTPRQEQLYAALSGLDEQYVDEALNSGKHTALPILRRAAAIAALLALIIGLSAILPVDSSQPIFFTTVNASDDLDTSITITANLLPEYSTYSGHIIDSLPTSWMDMELFLIQVAIEHADEDFLTSSYVSVEYNETTITDDTLTDQLYISFSDDDNNSLCKIYGWAQDISVNQLIFTINVYHTDNNVETLICKQQINVHYFNNRLIINEEVSKSASKKWTINLLSTEELVDLILQDTDPPLYIALSSAEQMLSTTHVHYAEIIAILDTRDDAASTILSKLLETVGNHTQVDNPSGKSNQIHALTILLVNDYFYQLTEEEISLLNQFLQIDSTQLVIN